MREYVYTAAEQTRPAHVILFMTTFRVLAQTMVCVRVRFPARAALCGPPDGTHAAQDAHPAAGLANGENDTPFLLRVYDNDTGTEVSICCSG